MRKWNPVAALDDSGAWLTVFNALPTPAGAYAPGNLYAQHVGAGPSTPGTTLRFWCALLADDTATGYIGTTTKLYHYDGTSTFTDRSVGGGYTNTATDWSFAQYGNNTYATNRVDVVQSRDSSAGGGGSAFAALAGSPAKARILVTQADQLLLFDLNDGSEKPDAFAASAPGDPTDWSGSGATTPTRIRHRPGKIRAAVAFRDYVLVFKRGSIYRLYYTGNSTFKWKVELIAIGKGAWDMHSVVCNGDVVAFVGPGGAWTYDGASFRQTFPMDFGGDTSPTYRGGYYSHASKTAFFFHIESLVRYFAYSFASDRWGDQKALSTTAAIAATYRPLTGEPAALLAFTSTVGASYPDEIWLADLSTDPCIVKSSTKWGGGNGHNVGSQGKFVLRGTYSGVGGDAVMQTDRIIPDTDLYYDQSGFTVPGATELSMTLYQSDTADRIWGATTTSHTSSTNQRRFDINVASVYILPEFSMGNDGGYLNFNDYIVKQRPAGTL